MTQEELGLSALLNYLSIHSDFYTNELLCMAERLLKQGKGELYAEILSAVQMLKDVTARLEQTMEHLQGAEHTCEQTA